MGTLHNTTIFITGATSGFGRALALMCAAQGAKVIATGRRQERLSSLRDEVQAIQRKNDGSPRSLAARDDMLQTLCLDVRDKAAVDAACKHLAVDVLVNNAGLALGLASFENQLPEDNQQMVDTNINGLIYVTQAVLPNMIARGKGHIINISSTAANYPYPGGNVYGGTKAFVSQFSLNLRADLLGKNIRVTSIEPGMSETEFSLTRMHGDAAKASNVYAGMTPLSAEDVAGAIMWCITQPAHVNVNRLELMPTQQAFSPFAVSRTS